MQNRCVFWAFAFLIMSLLFASKSLADDTELVEMIVELLKEDDKDMRALAFEQIRTEAKGAAATEQFAGQLAAIPAESKVGLISALADRGDVVAKPTIIELLETNELLVRVAAIRAIAKLGDTSDCGRLVALLDQESVVREAARTSLIQLQGERVSKEIAAKLNAAPASLKVKLIDILSSRRAFDTIPDLLQLAIGDDTQVRTAAMSAVGKLGGAEHIPQMVQGVLKAERGTERSNAERSVAYVCNRIEDKLARADPLVAAIKRLSKQDQNAMLVTLGRVGGPAALVEIEKAIGSEDGATHSMGLSAICNWPDSTVADLLTELAYNDPHIPHQRMALRALIRVAPLDDGRTYEDKLKLLQKAMDMSHLYADRKYALQRASAIRSLSTLRWVLTFIDDPQYAEQACRTIVELAHIRDLRDQNKKEFHAALDKVVATSTDAEVLERADRYKKGQTWVRPR